MKSRGWFMMALFLLALPVAAAAQQTPDDVEVIAGILYLEDAATYEDSLKTVLLDRGRSPLVRGLAARAIGHIGNPVGADALLKALDDNTLDQAMLCECLACLFANTPARAYKYEVDPAVPRRLRVLATENPDRRVKAAALKALALAFPGQGWREAYDQVKPLFIEAGPPDEPTRALLLAAVRVAAQHGRVDPFEPEPLLRERLDKRQAIVAHAANVADERIAYEAVYFASRDEALELDLNTALLRALEHQAAPVRAQALRSLTKRKVKNEQLVGAVMSMLTASTRQERIAAVQALPLVQDNERAFQLLAEALEREEAVPGTSVHQAILETMSGLDVPDKADRLWTIAQRDTGYRQLARLAAAQAGAVGPVKKLAAADFADSEAQALDYVALLDAVDDQGELNRLLRRDGALPVVFADGQAVRQRIVMALVYDAKGQPLGQAVDKHPEWLADADPVVVEMALESLGAQATHERLKRLTEETKKLLAEPKDRPAEPLLAALNALQKMTIHPDTNVAAAVVLGEMARRCLDDPRLAVRRQAVALLYDLSHEIDAKALYGSRPVRTGESYRAVARQLVAGERYISVLIRTDKGPIPVTLDRLAAPLTVDNFLTLVNAEFYDSQVFHRVVPAFVIQAGDPHGLGWGGPGYAIRDEEGALPFAAGVLGMASAGHDTAGSQFFLTALPAPHLDGRYTAFGQITDPVTMEVIEKILPGDRLLTVREVKK